ncbi:MAG: hypothetical protein FWG98_10260 [Candidatus Cloacimonetes bacterium]|nr:hypothetical protein [Candidatus Cloacimonadota bacterium]
MLELMNNHKSLGTMRVHKWNESLLTKKICLYFRRFKFNFCGFKKCFTKKLGTISSFEYLINLGIENNIFDKDFVKNDCSLYVKRFNF